VAALLQLIIHFGPDFGGELPDTGQPEFLPVIPAGGSPKSAIPQSRDLQQALRFAADPG
jgi:hypothetical protein